MHGKYPLPPEGALPEYPSRNQKEIGRVPRHLEGWRVGNKKRARPCWLGARGSAQNCLIEPFVRALPPPGGLLAEGPVAYALRAPPQTSVSATLLRQTEWRCPGLGPANSCTITEPSKLGTNAPAGFGLKWPPGTHEISTRSQFLARIEIALRSRQVPGGHLGPKPAT